MDTPQLNLFRAATPAETHLAHTIGCPEPDWITHWIDNGWTPDQIKHWYPVTAELTHIDNHARPLRDAGFTPQQVRDAMNGARIELPDSAKPGSPIYTETPDSDAGFGLPRTPRTPDSHGFTSLLSLSVTPGWDPDLPVVRIPGEGVTALLNAVALSRYLTDIETARTSLRTQERALLMDAMRATNMPDTDIATHTGLSKQRVGAILGARWKARRRSKR